MMMMLMPELVCECLHQALIGWTRAASDIDFYVNDDDDGDNDSNIDDDNDGGDDDDDNGDDDDEI